MWFFKGRPMRNVNMPLVERVFEQIRETPQLWDQANWSENSECGTTHCFGGWACVLEERVKEVNTDYGHTQLLAIDEDGDTSAYAHEAAKLLGFNPVLAGKVFYNTDQNFELFEKQVREDIKKYGNMTKRQVKRYQCQ
jgi:hypothetical protein